MLMIIGVQVLDGKTLLTLGDKSSQYRRTSLSLCNPYGLVEVRRCFAGIEFEAYSSMLLIVYLCYILAVRRFDG